MLFNDIEVMSSSDSKCTLKHYLLMFIACRESLNVYVYNYIKSLRSSDVIYHR